MEQLCDKYVSFYRCEAGIQAPLTQLHFFIFTFLLLLFFTIALSTSISLPYTHTAW